MNSRHLMTAQEARTAHLQRAQQRRLQRAALPLLAPYVPSLRNDDNLPLDRCAGDLLVRIPALPGLPAAGEGLLLFWDDAPAGDVRWLAGCESYPLDMHLPKAFLEVEGSHSLSYRIVTASEHWPCSESRHVVIAASTVTANGTGQVVGVDPEIDEIGLTLDYLEKHQDQLRLSLPMPARLAHFVGVELYWRTALLGIVTAARLDITAAHRAGAPVEVTIDGEFMRRHADASVELSYALLDAIGQRTLASPLHSIELYLTPLPERLPPPRVPLADDPIGIDRADVRCGVSVEIPFIEHAKSGDRVVVCWGRERLPAQTIGDPRDTGFPLQIEVPASTLSRFGSGQIEVFYELHRGEFQLTSAAIDVAVDLEVSGLGAPHLEESLRPATVRGALSGFDDEITPADVGKPVLIQVPFHEGVRVDDRVRVYWGSRSLPVAEYPITRGDIEQRMVAPIAIDWTYVALEGNAPALAVRYSLGSPLDDNQAFARETPVNVHFALPGGPSGLAEVAFIDSNVHGWLTPGPDPQPHARLRVPAYRNMAVGDVIQLFWQGLDDTAGTGNAIPGTDFGPVEVAVTAAHLTHGIEVCIDWEPCVRDIVHGSARVQYSVRQGDVLFRGPDALVRVDTRGAMQDISRCTPFPSPPEGSTNFRFPLGQLMN